MGNREKERDEKVKCKKKMSKKKKRNYYYS